MTLRAAVVQIEHAPADKAANFAKVEAFARRAKEQGVELCAFPECCISGYWFMRNLSLADLKSLAEPVPAGPSTQRLLALAKQLDMTIGAGLVEHDPATDRLHNTYVVAMPDGRFARHRKINSFEHEHISPGDAYTVFDLPNGTKCGVLICYDNNLVENVRITALMGAEVLLSPHQTGGCNSVSPAGMKPIDLKHWHNRYADPDTIRREITGPKGKEWIMRWLPSRAHDNGLFLLFANGVGIDDDEVRTGNSMILDPYGRVVANTDEPADDIAVADLDLSLVPLSTGRRWLRARRPELYAPLTVRTGIEQPTRALKFEK